MRTLLPSHVRSSPRILLRLRSLYQGELTSHAAADAGRLGRARIWRDIDDVQEGLLGTVMQSLPEEGVPPPGFFKVEDGPFVPLDLPPYLAREAENPAALFSHRDSSRSRSG